MKHLDLSAYEPGEMFATVSKDGKVAMWTVAPDGSLVPSDNRMFATGLSYEDPIEALDLSVRTYNVLKREGVHTIKQVVSIYEEKGAKGFDDMRNMGEKSRDEIVNHIKRLQGMDL